MTLTTRRRFVRQTVFAAAALYGHRVKVFAGPAEKNAVPLDPLAIRKLASAIHGHVITPEAADYEFARLVFNRAFDLRPALIVRCANASDVGQVLDLARTRNLPLAIRAGGHSRAGFSVCDGGVVIDLSGMKRVEVDAQKRIARAEAGSLVSDLDAATRRFGLATPSGGCPNVGMAGLTLGGGQGAFLGCDTVRRTEQTRAFAKKRGVA